MRHVICIVVCVFGLAGFAQADVLDTFDTAGSITGYAKAPTADGGSSITWESTGGNPDGFLKYNESAQGGLDRLILRPAFTGDKSAYYDGTFGFDHIANATGSEITRNNDVELVGAGLVLRFDLPTPGNGVWASHVIDLNDTAGWIDDDTGLAATETQIRDVLAALDDIILHADFHGSPAETSGFDNVALTIPEPTTLLIANVAMAALVLRRR